MIILPANTLSTGGFAVANSVRFNDNDSPSMYKTPGSGGNQTTWTFSTWFKRGNLGSSQWILDAYDGSNDEFHIYISSGNAIGIYTTGGGFGSNKSISTNNLVRDVSAWYHLVVRCDTTQSTASNRLRIYLNGTECSYATYNNFTEDGAGQVSESGTKHWIGRRNAGDYFDGYFAEMVLVDGSSLAPTSFGEYDEDSPTIWKPKDVSGLTFGTNGFYLDFEDSSNLGNDANGGTDLTESNLAATDQSLDSPTNNFPTLNVLYPTANLTFSEGNLNVVASDANYRSISSTMGATAGKWYAEFKAVSGFSGVDKSVGIYRADNTYVSTTGLGNFTSGTTWSYGAAGLVRTNNGTNDTEATFTDGDIISIAMDLDNNKLYFAKNNSWINSGDPTSGSTGTGAYAIVNATPKEFYHFAVASISSGGAALWSCNFGSPSYANSSDAADANGYGAFEYAPPSGYLALCTKNLGSDGG
tara:strand:- start:278 stop:1690 length:1413 start_codon:yes stop_codon:yes gene_type:complete